MPISQWIDEIHADLTAGASKVILESRESGKSGICDAKGRLRKDLVASISKSRFRASDAIWEAPNKTLQTNLIYSLGPNVNLGNIAFGDVVGLETLRLGIRSDTFTLYNGPDGNFVDPQVSRKPLHVTERRRASDGLASNRGQDRRESGSN